MAASPSGVRAARLILGRVLLVLVVVWLFVGLVLSTAGRDETEFGVGLIGSLVLSVGAIPMVLLGIGGIVLLVIEARRLPSADSADAAGAIGPKRAAATSGTPPRKTPLLVTVAAITLAALLLAAVVIALLRGLGG